MTVLKILTAPDPRLKKISEPVERVDDGIRKLMKDLEETAIDAGNSLGMAAPQIGALKRVIYIDISAYDDERRPKGFFPLYMANPELTNMSSAIKVEEEACFSVPGLGVNIPRAESIKVKYLDYNNNAQTIEASGLLAVVIQHEVDHLNGILTVDYLSPLKKDVAVRKLVKVKKLQQH